MPPIMKYTSADPGAAPFQIAFMQGCVQNVQASRTDFNITFPGEKLL